MIVCLFFLINTYHNINRHFDKNYLNLVIIDLLSIYILSGTFYIYQCSLVDQLCKSELVLKHFCPAISKSVINLHLDKFNFQLNQGQDMLFFTTAYQILMFSQGKLSYSYEVSVHLKMTYHQNILASSLQTLFPD